MPHAYLGVASLKSAITIASTDSTDDIRLRAVLEAVSQQIDDDCQRTFRVYTATKTLTARNAKSLLLRDDLLAVTTLKTDADGDRTYENTWATTDYDLMPDDATDRRVPYWQVMVTPDGDYTFPVGVRRGVQIVGRWGFWQDLLTLTATLNEVLDTTETGVDLSGVTEVEAGQTILIDSEQMYIQSISGSTLTVERGVNGTTAAAHSSGAAVSLYRYPAPIVEATRLAAARIFQRVHAPFGVTGSADMGTITTITRIDPDVKGLLTAYRSGVGLVA